MALPDIRVAMAARNWTLAQQLIEVMLGQDDGGDVHLHYLASVCCMRLGKLDNSLAWAQSAVMANRNNAAAWSQLGSIHYMMAGAGSNHYLEAFDAYERAYWMAPDVPAAAMGLAAACFTLGLHDRALSLFRQAQKPNPFPSAELSEGGLLLLLGQHAEGWRKHEARIGQPNGALAPRYDGSLADLKRKTVLVRAEQGLGDCIQFMRYIPILRRYCAHTIVEAYGGLEALMDAFTGCEVVTAPASDFADDVVQINLMSLPLLLGPIIGYAPIPPAPVPAQFRLPRKGIGICPTSIPIVSDDLVYAASQSARKSPPMQMMGTLAAEFGPMRSLLHADLQTADWLETATVVAGLERVLTVDTGVAHLAASLGVDTWVMQRFDECWRWAEGWYPSARIFRQTSPGDWGSVYRQVKDAFKA